MLRLGLFARVCSDCRCLEHAVEEVGQEEHDRGQQLWQLGVPSLLESYRRLFNQRFKAQKKGQPYDKWITLPTGIRLQHYSYYKMGLNLMMIIAKEFIFAAHHWHGRTSVRRWMLAPGNYFWCTAPVRKGRFRKQGNFWGSWQIAK
jgi:hypothetical protein